jgi:hypothetical protein
MRLFQYEANIKPNNSSIFTDSRSLKLEFAMLTGMEKRTLIGRIFKKPIAIGI